MKNLDKYRRKDGTINLEEAFEYIYNMTSQCVSDTYHFEEAIKYLNDVEDMQPIKSRQAAAIILVNAKRIYLTK